jgi:predicted transcriptional regulator
MPANNMSYAKIDKDIVRVLETDELSATGIARRSRYGRTTINYRLRKLQSAGMVSRSKVVGKEVFYVLNKKAANSARESRLRSSMARNWYKRINILLKLRDKALYIAFKVPVPLGMRSKYCQPVL